ncbi:MAG: hypothetical protein N3A57_06345, partial [Negativicutes bacterium]|nr:hypothetical protein [Negativicutes bacterium]
MCIRDSTQVVALGGLLATSSGLALGVPGVDPATYGYPTSNWQAWQSQNTAVNVQSMGNNSTGTMNITLNLAAGGDTNSGDSTVYNIYLNSQGLQNRQMSPQYTPPTSGVNMMNYLNGLWNVMITADAFISADPVAITGALLGDYQSIAGLVKSGASGQAGNSNKAYTVAYGPFIAYADNCTVTQGGVSIPFSQDMVNGDNNALLYDPNATMSTTNLNIFLRNQLVLIDFRQFTYENGVFAGLTTADTLYVAIINEAVQAAATAATMTQANALGQVDMVALNSNATPQQVTERRQMATRIYAAIAALNKINPRLAEAFADKFSFRAVTALEQLTPAEKKLAMKKLLTEAEEILKEIKKTDPGFNLNLI